MSYISAASEQSSQVNLYGVIFVIIIIIIFLYIYSKNSEMFGVRSKYKHDECG